MIICWWECLDSEGGEFKGKELILSDLESEFGSTKSMY